MLEIFDKDLLFVFINVKENFDSVIEDWYNIPLQYEWFSEHPQEFNYVDNSDTITEIIYLLVTIAKLMVIFTP